jgi:hypothetical protein
MSSLERRTRSLLGGSLLVAATLTAHATLPEWLQHVVGASSIEAALYRTMSLPAVQALYPRPPKESQTELARLIASAPDDSQLYAFRAQADESALDFAAAESDWKLSVAHSKDPVNAKLQLADFYQRRLLVPQELAALTEVAAAPPIASERFVDPAHQRSWLTYNRMLALVADQGLPPAQTATVFQAFIVRYPDQPAVYAEFLSWQLSQKDWAGAETLIGRYKQAFPQDGVFPIRAQALLEYRRGNIDRALSMYDRSFQPLWPAELVQSYFALLDATHRQRAFVADARNRLAQHPDGPEALNALAGIFYYDQQAGRLDRAQQTLDGFRIAREARGSAWTANDLATLAALTDDVHSYAESARYNYALASTTGNLPSGEPAAQAGLAALVHLLLSAPDQPIALGAGNLSMYRDIATLDQGPGYWNGIMSLWLNGSSPESEYDAETAKAQSYFHRSKAAELLVQLDTRYAAAPERAGLHAELIRTYAQYGESNAVVAAGQQFLADFKAAPDRVAIAGLMADAYARQGNTAAEFALYDALLAELDAKTGGLPLTAGNPGSPTAQVNFPYGGTLLNPDAAIAPAEGSAAPNKAASAMRAASYELTSYRPSSALVPEAVQYAQVLDRYLGRLVAEKQLPQALVVLRHQLDQNPNDPMLYERLANFLQQNNLSEQQEAIYRQAVAKFNDPGWYDKLARLYLRRRNRQAYVALTHQVSDIFAGTDLDNWFRSVGSLTTFNDAAQPAAGPQLALQLNLYAQKRFPHDLVFTHNLLNAYRTKPTANPAAYEDLLRRHWWESDDLRAEFFAYLARTGKLQGELAQLQPLVSGSDAAATRELAEIDIWTSRFEAAAPLMGSVAELYPADATVGDQAVSLYRSLAYQDPTLASTKRAVAIETNLSAATPNDANRLTTLGDLYAEVTANGGEDIRAASPYWRRIPTLHPGTPAGYLTSATVFWDYFQFDDALAELRTARTRFHQPTLSGYEAGAIAENRRDLAEAVAEYTGAATTPPDAAYFIDSLNGAIDAFVRPPSDAADSNLRSTTQSLFNSAAARSRLLQLAIRPATKALVDTATAKAVAAAPTPVALTLRADVLIAQKRQAELSALLDEALTRAKTADEAAAIGDLARSHSEDAVNGDDQLREVTVTAGSPATVGRSYARSGSYSLAAVYEHALEKQIAVTTDPVQKIELSYTLSSSLESRKDIAGATRIIESVYKDNPRILGVVRATTDFYARTNQPPRAIATLLASAKVATPELARNFTLEAAQKANDAGDTKQARALAESMRAETPYDATVLGIIAASYANAHDDAGLKAFYLAQLAAVKAAPLSAEERKEDTALLRRGLIPALTRTKDYAGAIDQYIALLSAYPEDSSTAQEAALYALRYGRQTQLLGFLRTTVKQAPKDSRFAILLAEVDTTFDDLPGAVAAYSQAIAIRNDRADLYSARVDLELRLGLTDAGQMDAAADDFQRLYVLSYKDPSWMLRLGELRARQQRPADAVKALETAWITGQTANPSNQFRVADQLAQWNLLIAARDFADQGMKLAGSNLLTNTNGGAATYGRIMTRLGKPDQALAALTAANRAVQADTSFPPAMAAAYAKEGVSARDIAQAKQAYFDTRRQTARQQLDQAVNAIGQTIQTYYTPERKLAYAQTLDTLHSTNAALALEAAAAAGLTDREAEWRKQIMLTGTIDPHNLPDSSAYVALERHRLDFGALAQTLEAFAARIPAAGRSAILAEAAQAYRDAGDETNEIRITRPLVLAQDQGLRDRLFDLLLRHDRASLVALAGSKDDTLADAAANYVLARATQAQALAAVAARSRGLPVVWRPATASLVLTNFASSTSAATPAMVANFTQSLNSDATIAARLARPANTASQLTGDLWFYYAKRFGIFLATVPKAQTLPDSEDFMSAELERAPSAVVAYLHLARNYAEAGNLAASVTEYNHALELAPNNPAVHDEFAVVLYRANRRDEAAAQWRAALELIRKRQIGEEFFTTFRLVVNHLSQRSLFAMLRPDAEAVLRAYFGHNGNYRSNELLEAIYKASATPEEGIASILATSSSAPDPEIILSDLANSAWLPVQQKQALLLHRLQIAREAAAHQPTEKPATGDSGMESESTGNDYAARALKVQFELLRSYMDENQDAQAQELIDSIPAKQQDAPVVQQARIVLAARGGRLDAMIAGFRTAPDKVPPLDTLMTVANELARSNKPNSAAARSLREYVFEQKQLAHSLQPTDFLSLAQSRLDTTDIPGALELLHRLSLQPVNASSNYSYSQIPPDPYANSDSAAALLESNKRYAEAIPFLTSLTQSVPWNPSYRLRLGEARLKGGAESKPMLLAIASDTSAPYSVRLQAANDLGALPVKDEAPNLGSGELVLLATNPGPTPTAARHPYFTAARVAAASASSASRADRIALLHEAIAIEPSGESTNRALLDLLLTQTPVDSASATLAIYKALSNAQPDNASQNQNDVELESDASASTNETPEDPSGLSDEAGIEPMALPFPLAHTLDRPAQIRLATLLASAFNREHNPTQSLFFDRLAVQIDAQNPKPDPVVVKRLADFEAAQALEKKNALRRPLIHADLDQSVQVRPRLTLADQARAEAP